MFSNEVNMLIGRARENLAAAQLLTQNDLNDDAASRAYYAVFHAAEAFLVEEGLSFKKHSAVLSNFTRLAHEQGFPNELLRAYRDALEIRTVGDYGSFEHVAPENFNALLPQIKRFVDTVEARLRERGRDKDTFGRSR